MTCLKPVLALLVMAALISTLVPVCSAGPEEGPPLDLTITAKPSKLTVRQGSDASTTMTIKNNENRTLTLILEVPNFDSKGAPSFKLDKEKITLAPNASEAVKLTVSAPALAETGGDWDAWLCISTEGQDFYNGAPNTTSFTVDVEVTGAAGTPGYLVVGMFLAVVAIALACGRMRLK